jgi:hypothetical protein
VAQDFLIPLDLNVPDFVHITNVVLLVVIILLLRPYLRRWWRRLCEHWRDHQPRHWKPQSPDDCPHYGTGLDRPHLGGQRPVALSRAAGCLRLP